jgi:type II secretory pathway pseudopilin PulG
MRLTIGTTRRVACPSCGLTLIELVIAILAVGVSMAALLGSFMGQVTLSEHARNMGLATNDLTKIAEQLRRQNVGVGCPLSAIPPVGTSWDAWLASGAGGGGKMIGANPAADERVVFTCVRRGAPAPPANPGDYCGSVDQVGAGEWRTNPANTNLDPLQVTAAVCWRHRGRVIGECTWDGAALQASDADADGVIESPIMVTTLVTCKG